jgi:hypothetical protein
MRKKYTTEEFVKKLSETFGERYDTSKVEYADSQTKICLICREKDKNGVEHGEFYIAPYNLLRGRGCPKCANEKRGKHFDREYFIQRAEKKHNGKYRYLHFKPENSSTPGLITCPVHGDFEMSMNNHVNMGQGCPKCAGRSLTIVEIKEKFKEVDGGRYGCLEVEMKKLNDKWRFLCPVHGEFMQTATKHLQGQGCPKCKKVDDRTISFGEFKDKAVKVHGNIYEYPEQEIHGYKGSVDIICKIHGKFSQLVVNHLQGCGCPKCSNNNSKGEDGIAEFLSDNGFGVFVRKDRGVIPPYEVDIYFPEQKIGIEYNGLLWHSDKYRPDSDYHLKKTNMCAKQGIRLIHIYEDEWLCKREIVESRLRSIFGKMENRVYARECEIREAGYEETKEFLEKSHIQGNCVSKYRYGLYKDNELVSVMTFGKLRKNTGNNGKDGSFELLRFCNKLETTVVGGASRLLKHFIEINHPDEIVSYSDRRWSDGSMYRTLGFTLDHTSKPNYFYVVNGKRENRFAYRKDILVEKYGCDPDMSEKLFMETKGWYRIYDCGTMVWKKKLIS